MPGLLRRLFSPRWQHSDSAVRREAAARLAFSSQREALEQLAQDPEPDVRLAALQRIEDPEHLLTMRSKGQGSRELDQHLCALLCGRIGNIDLARRQHMVETIDDPELLEVVALQGDNQQLRLSALQHIEEESLLIRQACDNSIAAVRHAAAKRITSEEGLKTLAHSARRDRHVMRDARDRLNRLRADADAIQRAKKQRESLLNTLEQHSKSTWEPLYAGRFRHLEREWNKLASLPDASQESRFQDACLRCRKVIQDHEAQEHALQTSQQQREQADQEREALVMALEDSLQALHQGETLTDQDLASLRSQKQITASRWQSLSERHLANESLRQRYDKALKTYDQIHQAYQRLYEHADALKAAIQEGNEDELTTLVIACDWPSGLPLDKRLARAVHYLHLERDLAQKEDDSETEQRIERFDTELVRLESLLDDGSFKGASRLHQRLRHLSERLPASAEAQHARLKRLGARLAELRDWRGFVAKPKREQLCQAIEALKQNTQLSERDRDHRHRQLVKEWKALGDAAASREHSERFRTASDHIRATLEEWHEHQQQERLRNLKEREALCEQLEALLEQPAAHADPDALRLIRDQARDRWHRTSPVPRDQAESIGRRFGRIRHHLQALIDRRANEIAEAKRALIEEIQTLSQAELSAEQRASRAKALQQRWRELGRAPKGEEQALWRQFRHLCDRIFADRDAKRDDKAQKTKERLEQMQALIDRLDAWQPTHSQDASFLDQALSEAQTLEPLPSGRRTEGMRKRWTGIVRARRERLERIGVAEKVNRWRQLTPLINAHLHADNAALSGHHHEDVEVPEGLDLSNALLRAHNQRNVARHHPPAESDVAERLTRLRVHLSLLAGGPVLHQEEPLRLAIQVERLNDNLGQVPERADELASVLCELLATGPVSSGLWQREVGELDRLLDSLTHLPPP
uniref:DUF349 domain-containing protein n=1 Tax=Halomonas sp. TaxID=1486246 RepID=UPI002619E8C4|nr:DUF349 domain-containing protein [Halomonas sp.]